MIRKCFFAVCLMLLALEGAPINATTLKALSFEELLGRADLIVRGQVRDQRCEWRGGVIVTLSRVEVTEVLRGGPVREVEVMQLGGRIGDHWMPVAGVAELVPGQPQVLMLKLEARQPGVYIVAGMSQGALTLIDDDRLLWAPRAALWRDGQILAPRSRYLSLSQLRHRLGGQP